jgi:FMN-dependent NADH-azoreductase
VAHLLHIDTSSRQEGSVSRELTRAFADAWTAAHPDGTVTYRDLAVTPVPYPDMPDLGTSTLPVGQRPEHLADSFAITDTLIEELEAADTYVIGAPMYNFMVSASLKAWVDRIVLPGRTFDTETRQGKLVNKDVTIITSRGGSYAPGTPRAGFDFQEPWLKAALGQVGLDDIRFIHAEMTLAKVMPKLAQFVPLAEESYDKAVATIKSLF